MLVSSASAFRVQGLGYPTPKSCEEWFSHVPPAVWYAMLELCTGGVSAIIMIGLPASAKDYGQIVDYISRSATRKQDAWQLHSMYTTYRNHVLPVAFLWPLPDEPCARSASCGE